MAHSKLSPQPSAVVNKSWLRQTYFEGPWWRLAKTAIDPLVEHRLISQTMVLGILSWHCRKKKKWKMEKQPRRQQRRYFKTTGKSEMKTGRLHFTDKQLNGSFQNDTYYSGEPLYRFFPQANSLLTPKCIQQKTAQSSNITPYLSQNIWIWWIIRRHNISLPSILEDTGAYLQQCKELRCMFTKYKQKYSANF